MLVLSFHHDESAVVDLTKYGLGYGRVTLVDIRGNKVRLGFDFPRDIDIDREAVFQAKQREADGLADTAVGTSG